MKQKSENSFLLVKRIVRYVSLVAVLFLFYSPIGAASTNMVDKNLRCEHLSNPLGIDNESPFLSWELYATDRAKMQTAYEIIVSTDLINLKKNIGNVWSTGKVKGNTSTAIRYEGKRLNAATTYYWKVRVWDESGRISEWSELQLWSMGLLKKEDWKAKWIGLPSEDSIINQDKYTVPPSPLLRKEFRVKKKINRATLYATALGVYEISINGKKVGEQVLAPEWTDYTKRVQYQTFDVTTMLSEDGNVIGAMLADGWYAGALWSYFYRGRYGYNRRLLAQLQIDYTDGTSDIVVTDENWKILKEGSIKEASIFNGEVYDARAVPKGWQHVGFDDNCWEKVFVEPALAVQLNAQMNQPIKVIKEISPVSFYRLKRGKYDDESYIFDMGQNMTGWVQLRLPYNPGKKISIKYAEMLNEDSTLYWNNLRNAHPMDIYIPDRASKIDYEPKFTYHGFRYVEITGLSEIPNLNNLSGKVVASSSPVASSFETSDKTLNKLWSNILWTQIDNMISIPTDCPQRDERCGWMADAQVFSQTSIYNMDMQAFYKKWLRDIRDEQTTDGRLPNYAPYVTESLRYYDAPGWVDAGVIIPWKTYVNYGNENVLKNNFEMMCKFIDRVFKMNPNLLRTNEVGQNYGDWLNGNSIKAVGYPTENGSVPKDLFSTAYFAYSTNLLAKTAKVLGKATAFKHYDSLANAIKEVFVKNYINGDGIIKGNTQAGYALALEFELVPMKLKSKVIQNMVKAIEYYDYRISTGIHSTEKMMEQLSKNGYSKVAYKLLESRRFPSWFYSIDQGASTIWERWDGFVKGRGFQDPDMNSFNHPAFGSIGEWMYKYILGIKADEASPGYTHFFIEPQPGGSLTWAKGQYHAIVGNVGVHWEKSSNEAFTYHIDIPANSTATLTLPTGKVVKEGGLDIHKAAGVRAVTIEKDKTILSLGSGSYEFAY